MTAMFGQNRSGSVQHGRSINLADCAGTSS